MCAHINLCTGTQPEQLATGIVSPAHMSLECQEANVTGIVHRRCPCACPHTQTPMLQPMVRCYGRFGVWWELKLGHQDQQVTGTPHAVRLGIVHASRCARASVGRVPPVASSIQLRALDLHPCPPALESIMKVVL